MREQFARTEMLFGAEAMEKLKNAKVAIFGIGGVGGYVAEALARSGIGKLELIDNDTVSESNINRQIIALHSTVGEYKVDVAKKRIYDICPDIEVKANKCFFLPETANEFDFTQYDYVIDAIDTVSGKIELALQAQKSGVKIISSMGTGNKLDPTQLKVADIYDTKVCPLARVMRTQLRKRGIESLKVVYSEEEPIKPYKNPSSEEETKADCETKPRRDIPASNAFVPSVAGLIIAGEVIKDITGISAKR